MIQVEAMYNYEHSSFTCCIKVRSYFIILREKILLIGHRFTMDFLPNFSAIQCLAYYLPTQLLSKLLSSRCNVRFLDHFIMY